MAEKLVSSRESTVPIFTHQLRNGIFYITQLTLQLFPFSPYGFKEVNKQLINLLSPQAIKRSYTALTASGFVYVKSKTLISQIYSCLLI